MTTAVLVPANVAHSQSQQFSGMPVLNAPHKPTVASSHSEPTSKVVKHQPVYVDLPDSAPRSYTILKEVGDGSFGTVWLADWHSHLELPPGTLPPGPSSRPEYAGKKLVAIKRMKKQFHGGWAECMKLKELKSLRTIEMHPNIIPLYDAFLMPSTKELYFVFECMEGNLYQLTKSRKGRPLTSGLTASIFHQILLGLDHIHSSGFFHRDMKPENLLITTTGLANYLPSAVYRSPDAPFEKDVTCIVKLADFGLARETNSKPPYTEYVSTRWYRAPEVLLRSRDYSNPVDMWALGTIVAEMVNLKPLFPGQSEIDQVIRICQILGDPVVDYGKDSRGQQRGGGLWPKGVKLARAVGFHWPKSMPIPLSSLFDASLVPYQLVDCIAGLLKYDPESRLTTKQCLDHAYFREVAPLYQPVPQAPVQTQTQLPPTPTSSRSSQSSYVKPITHHPLPVPMRSPPPTGQTTWPIHVPANFGSHYSIASMPESVVPSSSGTNMVPWERMSRQQSAVSSVDFYDGSIFEGIAPIRDVSGYQYSPAVSVHSFSQGHEDQQTPTDEAAAYEQQRQAAELHQRQQSYPQPPAKSKWSLFASSHHSHPPPMQPSNHPGLVSVSGSSLKRSTSQRSMHQAEVNNTALEKDPKKAKKQAEREAREAERARREAAAIAARERSRAVMQKKNQLQNMADPYNMAHIVSPESVLANGKFRGSGSINGDAHSSAASFKTTTLPKIAEHMLRPSRLSPAMGADVGSRWKSRKRADDDDVHSVSSNETRHSNERPYSVASFQSRESDPGPGRQVHPHLGPTRATTASSFSSLGSVAPSVHTHPGLEHFHLSHLQEHPPGTSSSSVDYHLAQNFSGLTATDGAWARAASPRASPSLSNSMAHESTGFEFGAGTTFNPALHSLTYQQRAPGSSRSNASHQSLPGHPVGGLPPVMGMPSSASIPHSHATQYHQLQPSQQRIASPYVNDTTNTHSDQNMQLDEG